MTQEFLKPPHVTNPSGEERKIGFEFEFTGVKMERVAALISKLYGGNIRQISTYKFKVEATDFGNFILELDAQLLLEKKYEKFLRNLGIDLSEYKNQDTLEDSLKELVSTVVPFEIITPPVPFSKMQRLTALVDKMRQQKAKGTGSSILYAFGFHINPEIPDDSVNSLLDHLRAFIMLDSWIRKDAAIDVSRRMTPFINKFENKYIQYILNPGYEPDMEEFIRDYFEFGNSRNRPLDMQPLFMYLNQDLTSSLVTDTLTSARPTYHYRLPNCSLEDESWLLANEWNRWVLVEKLAEDKQSLNQYSRAYLKMNRETMIGFEAKWLELMERWVRDVR